MWTLFCTEESFNMEICPPINSSVKVLEKNRRKEVPCLEKDIGAFLFRVVLKLKSISFSVYKQLSTPPRTHFMLGFAGRTEYYGEITRPASALVSMPELLPHRLACAGISG
jgi:hypothetical protein